MTALKTNFAKTEKEFVFLLTMYLVVATVVNLSKILGGKKLKYWGEAEGGKK